MSFLGSIGTYMIDLGSEQASTFVYAPNAGNSLLTGKAYARTAIRDHFLLDLGLFCKLISEPDQPRNL